MKIMVKIISIVLLLFCTIGAGFASLAHAAGSISGQVVDAETDEVIIGAGIGIGGSSRGALADENGRYKISTVPEGSYVLTASMIGYEQMKKPVVVKNGENALIDFELTPDAVVMGEVRVRGSLEKETLEIQELRRSPVAVTVIDGRDFRGRDVSLKDIISKVAGVKIRSEGGLGGSDRIAVHGMEGKRIKLFIDGSPVEAPDGSFGINDIPVQLIKRIEIYKGVVPAHFGGDCLGGAVNVVIREFETDYVDLNYSNSSFNTHRGSLALTKVFDDPGIQILGGGFYNSSDNDYKMKSPYQPSLVIKRDHNYYRSFAGALQLKFKKAWFDEAQIALEFFGNKKEIQGIQTNIQHAYQKSLILVPEIEMEKSDFLLDGLDLDWSLAGVGMTSSFVDKSEWRYTFDGRKYRSPNGRGETGYEPHDSDDSQRELRTRLNFLYHFHETNSLNWNTIAKYSKREPDDKLGSKFAGYNVSSFPSETRKVVNGLTHELSIFEGKTVNSLSLKHFHIDSDIAATGLNQLSLHGKPKTVHSSFDRYGFGEALRHRLFTPLIVKASFERALRLPDPDEVFGDGARITPSPDLAPEKSNNANLGFVFDSVDMLGMPTMFVEVDGFYRYTKEMINLEGNGINYGYVNLGEIETKGVEGEIRTDVHKNVYLYTNATYQDLRDVQKYVPGTKTPNPTKGLRVPHIPWFFMNFGLELHEEDILGKDQFGKLFWEGSYVREYYYGWEMTSRQKRRIPSTFEQTVGIEYSFLNSGLIFNFEVHNIADIELYDIYNFPRPGRTFHVALRYSWFKDKSNQRQYRSF